MRGVLRSAVAVVAVGVVVAGSASAAPATHGRMRRAGGVSDPLIAAAGDIACDPSSSKFHGGQGTSSACRAKATGDLVLADPAIDAVLALGDNQYQCGGYQAYLQSFDPAWGRFKAKIHPVARRQRVRDGRDGLCARGGRLLPVLRRRGRRLTRRLRMDARRMAPRSALNAECGHAGGCGSSSPQATFLREPARRGDVHARVLAPAVLQRHVAHVVELQRRSGTSCTPGTRMSC